MGLKKITSMQQINYVWNEPPQASIGGEACLTIIFETGLKTLPPFLEFI
jgi:hypothetical protein